MLMSDSHEFTPYGYTKKIKSCRSIHRSASADSELIAHLTINFHQPHPSTPLFERCPPLTTTSSGVPNRRLHAHQPPQNPPNNTMRAGILHFLFLVASLTISCHAQKCTDYTFTARYFEKCVDLSVLNAKLHWTYTSGSGKVALAFRAPPGGRGYVSWGLNPSGQSMVGTQALVAVQNSSGNVWAYTTNLESPTPDMMPANLSTVVVEDLKAEQKGEELVIYATVTLPGSLSRQNHVWQASASINNGLPGYHGGGANKQSVGSIDFVGGTTTKAPIPRKRKVHGVLNAIAWGALMPIGGIIARYLRLFKSADPAWFYLHVACQCSAYGLGVAGWATGLKLGSDSPGITHTAHRTMGIALFCMATLQVFALLLRPNKDHKYRVFWNVYHHFIGYATIIISIVNIFEGFEILGSRVDKWKKAYIGVIASLGGIVLVLEVVKRTIVIRRRQRSEEKSHNGHGGATNGYGSRVV